MSSKIKVTLDVQHRDGRCGTINRKNDLPKYYCDYCSIKYRMFPYFYCTIFECELTQYTDDNETFCGRCAECKKAEM